MTYRVEITCVECEAVLLLVQGGIDTTTPSPLRCSEHPKARMRVRGTVDDNEPKDGA